MKENKWLEEPVETDWLVLRALHIRTHSVQNVLEVINLTTTSNIYFGRCVFLTLGRRVHVVSEVFTHA